MNIFSCAAVVLRRSRRGRSFDKTDYILSSFFMEKLEFPISNRGRVGFLAAPLRRKIIEREEGKLDEGKERKKKRKTCSFRSFQQRVTIFDGQTINDEPVFSTSPPVMEENEGSGGWADASKPGTKQITGPMGINIS